MRAVAAPMPDAAPEIRATLFASLIAVFPLLPRTDNPDDLCRRHGARAQPASRRDDGASGLRRRRSRVALARLSWHRRSNRAGAYPPLRRDHSATDRNAADRLVHRLAERQYTAPRR